MAPDAPRRPGAARHRARCSAGFLATLINACIASMLL
jgi:hypothetical protein